MSFPDKLTERLYSLYKTLRLRLSKIFPLSEYEQYRFDDDPFSKEESADMSQGFDNIANKSIDGFVKLDYIDLYDYLPKEERIFYLLDFVKTKIFNSIVRIFPYLYATYQLHFL